MGWVRGRGRARGGGTGRVRGPPVGEQGQAPGYHPPKRPLDLVAAPQQLPAARSPRALPRHRHGAGVPPGGPSPPPTPLRKPSPGPEGHRPAAPPLQTDTVRLVRVLFLFPPPPPKADQAHPWAQPPPLPLQPSLSPLIAPPGVRWLGKSLEVLLSEENLSEESSHRRAPLVTHNIQHVSTTSLGLSSGGSLLLARAEPVPRLSGSSTPLGPPPPLNSPTSPTPRAPRFSSSPRPPPPHFQTEVLAAESFPIRKFRTRTRGGRGAEYSHGLVWGGSSPPLPPPQLLQPGPRGGRGR